mmetsp:Transcript_7749/g.25731  ORF Transcript_7749/g.25731 Transcript_7749/m.25731 type:complete len:327 (+) Transcript_7749:85-1065(+)|eukprot:CAMPEP_0170154456 /NCGR_PEP_ID=MMETSP0033_2-20121228/57931_1 /TAXON_ID=195969 /ORGANISM="Dolichomastix tenuilepis, Strain CCMP3274" /LENGTH=326 /DNA_ID=CAMNT_0010391703 /DNA_START=20 /DNA_END=1000 /DNA_ORIENTATION=+
MANRGAEATASTGATTLGAYRNRTKTFMRYRQAGLGGRYGSKGHKTGADGLLNAALGGGDVDDASFSIGAAGGMPPGWVDASERVQTGMEQIRIKMAELKRHHDRSLLVTFDDVADDTPHIEVLTQEITRLFKRCEEAVRQLTGGTGGGQEIKVRKNVQISAATSLQKLSMEFRKMQKEYLQKLQHQQEGGGAGGGRGGALASFDDVGFSFDDDGGDPGFTDSQMQRVQESEDLVAEREREMVKIMESVNDLAQVMKDLSVLVIEQGTLLDRIDYNCEQVSVAVEQGYKELVKAEKTQKAGRLIYCIFFLAALVMVMLVIVIIRKS